MENHRNKTARIMVLLAVALFAATLIIPSALALYGGETGPVYHFAKCAYLDMQVTGTLEIDDGEYEFINNTCMNCTHDGNNRWSCSCVDGCDLIMHAQVNTINNYTLLINYTYIPDRDATVLGFFMPETMIAGRTIQVNVTMANTGLNTWTRALGYVLRIFRQNVWGIVNVRLPAGLDVLSGENHTFTFNITAPAAPGNYSSLWKMRQNASWFGEGAGRNISVIYNCTDNDNDSYYIYHPVECPLTANDCNDFNATINPGMPEICNNVDDNCDGTTDEGCPERDAECINITSPDSMIIGRQEEMMVTMKNTGTNDWTRALNYRLGSQNPQDNILWSIGRVLIEENTTVNTGSQYTFTFNITAPNTTGNHSSDWKMLEEWQAWFGETCQATIEVVENCTDADADGYSLYTAECLSGNDCNDSNPSVNPNATEICNGIDDDCDGNTDEGCPALDAECVNITAPISMIARQQKEMSVRMRNIGTNSWTPLANYRLGSQNPQDNMFWGFRRVNLSANTTITTGQEYIFRFNITAPNVTGNYSSDWRMVQELIAWFGDTCQSTIEILQNCSDRPEICNGIDDNCNGLIDEGLLGCPTSYSADCIDINIPASLKYDRYFHFNVTMRNNGGIVWNDTEYFLGSQNPENNTLWADTIRWDLPYSPVNLGDAAVFNLQARAPRHYGPTQIAYQMVNEPGMGFFGEICNGTIFINDTIAPYINPVQPIGFTNNKTITVKAFYQDDAQGSGINASSVRLWFDGTEVTNLAHITGLRVVYPWNFTSGTQGTLYLNDGNYTMNVTVSDNFGNTAARGWNIVIDTVPPALQILSPVNISYNHRNISVHIISSEILRSLGIDYTQQDFKEYYTVCTFCDDYQEIEYYAEVQHTLFAHGKDRAGNMAIINVSFGVDLTNPKIWSTSADYNTATKNATFVLRYVEESPDAVVLRYQTGTSPAVEVPLPWCRDIEMKLCNYTVLMPITNTTCSYNFTVNDTSGRSATSATKAFTIGRIPINIEIKSPQPETTKTSTGVRIDLKLNKKVSQLSMQVNDGSFARLCTNCDRYNATKTLRDGHYKIVFRAADYEGQSAESITEFDVDTKKPAVISIYPATNTLHGRNVAFKVYYEEANLEQVALAYRLQGAAGFTSLLLDDCLPGKKWCETNILMPVSGVYEYYFNVSDKFSTTASKTTRFSVDADPPVINSLVPLNNATYNKTAVVLSISAADNSGKLTAYYSLNGQSFRTLCRNSYCSQYSKTLASAAGNNQLRVQIIDPAGNMIDVARNYKVVV